MTDSVYSELFNLIYRYDIILLQSELEEIVQVCNRITEQVKPVRQTPTEKVLTEVLAEREKQNRKGGEQNHNLVEWIAILTEEVGEASREAVDFHFKNPVKNFSGEYEAPKELHQTVRLKRYRKELIQVAAVAVQMIESRDRNNQ